MKLATCIAKIEAATSVNAILVAATALKPRHLIPILASVKDADDKRLMLTIRNGNLILGNYDLDGKHLFYGLVNMIRTHVAEFDNTDEDTTISVEVATAREALEENNSKAITDLAKTAEIAGRSKMSKGELILNLLING